MSQIFGNSGGSGGSGIITIDGDSGSVTGATVTITGSTSGAVFTGSGTTLTESFNFLSLPTTTSSNGQILINGSTVLHAYGPSASAGSNTFVGGGAGNFTQITTSTENTGCGAAALAALTSGLVNSGFGAGALTTLTTGQHNVGIGVDSLDGLTTGSYNTSLGDNTGGVVSGSNNIIIGYSSGESYAGAESSNILINSTGTASESNAIHIGTSGSSAGEQNKCFIAGIAGVTVSSSAAVLINTSTGQLGTVSSSLRYKEDIRNLDKENGLLYDLNPVRFVFKKDKTKEVHYGLIAEEVNKVIPQLVLYDKEGNPDSVKYHELPALLLYELQRLRREIETLKLRTMIK